MLRVLLTVGAVALWAVPAVAQPIAAGIDDNGRIYVADFDPETGAFAAGQHVVSARGTGIRRGVVVGDFDEDGDLDLVAGTPSGGWIWYHFFPRQDDGSYRGQAIIGESTREASYQMDMAVGDLNADGHLDFVGNFNNQWVTTYLGDGTGAFTKGPEADLGTSGRGLDLADMDNDGWLDLVRARYSSGYIDYHPGQGDGGFGAAVRIGDAGGDPYGVTAADFDGDGNVDVIANAGGNGDISYFRGNGDGTFAGRVAINSLDQGNHGAFDAYDFDGDGDMDVVATNYTGRRFRWFANNGDATFAPAIDLLALQAAALGSGAPPLPPASASRAVIAPAAASVPINVPLDIDGSGSQNVATWAWDYGFAAGPQGNGDPGTVSPAFIAEGIYPITLTTRDADGKANVARVEVAATGEAPAIDPTPIALGEADATDGTWQHVFDVADLVDDDFGLATQSWSTHRLTDRFDAGIDPGWWLGEGTWVAEADTPIEGAGSIRQTNAGLTRSRILFRDMRYTGDVEIEFDFRMVAGAGKEVQLLLDGQGITDNYEIIIRGRGNDDVLFYRRQNDGTSTRMHVYQPERSPLLPFDSGRTYHVRVERIGARADVWIDDIYVGGFSDGTFRGGMVGFSTYQTDAIFDNLVVREIGRGETFDPVFTQPGAYTVDLAVADRSGQIDMQTIPVVVEESEAPTADGGQRVYTFDEVTGQARGGVYTATVDGTASSDPEGSALRYAWDFGTETFDGDVVDTGYWVVDVASQNDRLEVVGNGGWGRRYAFTRGTFARADGLAFAARVNATNRLMVGLKNENDNGQYGQYVYALYFNNGSFEVYENGAARGRKGSYTRGTDYDIRIETGAESGARYLYRASGGDGIWRELYRSGHSNHAVFRMGMDVLDGTGALDDFRLLAGGPEPSIPLAGPGEHPATLTVIDPAGNADDDTVRVVLQPNESPIADAGGDQNHDETTAIRGRWTIDFDGSASADDVGVYSYEWDFGFDPDVGFTPSGVTGANVAHVFEEGVHRVALRVTDNARQQDMDVITLTLVSGAPPIAHGGGAADGGPYVFDEFTGDAVGGGFLVTLDGTASSDAESAIRWVWDFGSDDFAGGYDPQKWIMYGDNALVRPVPPPGDACAFQANGYDMQPGRRYRHTCPAGCPLAGRLWGTETYTADSAVCLAAMHAGVLEPGAGGQVIYQLRGVEASYAASVANGVASQAFGGYENSFRFVDGTGTGLHVGNPSNTWGTRWAYQRDPLVRGEGMFWQARVRSTQNNAMVGLRDDVDNRGYPSMHYAFYFAGRDLHIYESGASRGDSGYDFVYGVDYDLRLDLKVPAGAVYWIKRADEEEWTRLYDSNHSNLVELHPSVDVYRGSFVIDQMREIAVGAEPARRMYGLGDKTIELSVYDQAEQVDTTEVQVQLRANEAPVARAGEDRVLGEAEAEGGSWTVDFDATPSTDDHGIYLYEWDYDYDGETFDVDALGAEVSPVFRGPGTNTVALRVTDHALQTHMDTVRVDHEGSEPPIANAGQNTVTEGVWPVAFDGSRSTDDIGLARFEWDFGDGMTGVGARPRHSYWAPGVYQVTLTVYDRAEQSDTDTIRVVVRQASEPPIAVAGGEYRGGAGGPPAHFDGRESADDFGVTKHLWDVDVTVDSDEDGDPANDVDTVGPRPMWTYAEAGEYTIRLTVVDGAGQAASDETTVEIVENLPPEVVTVPWVANDPRSRHHIINGRPVRLKAIVRDAGALTYQWDFGDGTPPEPAVPAPVVRKDAIEIRHTYPVSPNETPFVATLTVWDEAGESTSDIYPLIVQPDDLDTEVNIQIEESLWWLHKAQRDDGWWETRGYYTSPTSSALHAFVIHGHDQFGDNRENPFAETVFDGFHYLFRRLRSFNIEGQAGDTNVNGLGIDTNDARDPYQMGTAMDALASTNQPLYYAPSGDSGIRHRYYHELLWDMADAYIWGQSGNGGWYYSWRSGGADNSAAQWGAIGLIAAFENFRIPIPQSTKDRNMAWLRATSSSTGFGYSGRGSGVATTPSGMVQLVMNGVPTTDPLWTNGENWMAGRWLPSREHEYTLFATVKSLRLGRIDRLGLTDLDWFDDPVLGIRRQLLDSKLANHTRDDWGRWRAGVSWADDEMATAWAVVMLTPTLFQQPPVADAGRDITWAFDIPVQFDASLSTHRDSLRRVVKFEWDFDGDGTYDLVTDDPSDPRATFTYPDPAPDVEGNEPEVYYARLRVTDDNVPAQTDTDVRVVTVKDPPYQPIADIGGPYRAAAGIPIDLDASGSFDLDPEDRITRYQWDLTEQGPFFQEIDVTTVEPVITHTFPRIGRYVIGLRVRDAGRFNPPDCELGVDCDIQTSDPVFTTVEVVANQAPVPMIRPYALLGEGEVLRIDATPTTDPEGGEMAFEWACEGLEPTPVEGTNGRVIEVTAGDADYPAGGEGFPCVLTVADVAGAQGTLAFTVRGINRPPVVELVAGENGVEGGTVTVRIAATDPAPADAERLIYSVDCDGDGVIDVFDSVTEEVQCPYADDGVYVIAAVVDDDDGGQAVGFSDPIAIANLPPTIIAPPCPASTEGVPISVQFVTSDPAGAADPVLCALQAPIPDGAQLDAAACRLLWTPTYEQAGTMVRFDVLARDDDGASAEARLVCMPAWLDEDGDGLPDTWERDNDLDPTVDDCAEGLDADGDGIDNCAEFEGGTDPNAPDETTPPVLLRPIDEAVIDTSTPDLELRNATDSLGRALTYEYAVYTDEALADEVVVSDLVPERPDETEWTVPDGLLAENTWYWWTARAFNGDAYGPWAPPEQFLVDEDRQPPTAPTIVWPADGDAIAELQPTLVLDESTDPDQGDTLRYVCEIALDGVVFVPINGGEAPDSPDAAQTEVPIDAPLDENAAYRARCKAVDQTGLESPWSNVPRFTINLANDPPTAPGIVEPPHTSTIAELQPTLVASNAIDPEGEPLTYRFWISTDPTFPEGSTWISDELPEGEDGTTAWPLPEELADNTVYYWRVRARDPFVGGPAASARFRVDLGNEPPSIPTPLDPPDGAELTEMRPLIWAGSVDPDGDPVMYELLLVGTDNDVLWSIETPELTAEYPGELPLGRYAWRVRARDDRGGESDWSERSLFRLVAIILPDPEPDPDAEVDAEPDAELDQGGDGVFDMDVPPDDPDQGGDGVFDMDVPPDDPDQGGDLVPDTGPLPPDDAGVEIDAAPESDLGPDAGPDAGDDLDLGEPGMDARPPTRFDADVDDAGIPPGTEDEMGISGGDGGIDDGDGPLGFGGFTGSDGCNCDATERGGDAPWLVLLALLGIFRRRRHGGTDR